MVRCRRRSCCNRCTWSTTAHMIEIASNLLTPQRTATCRFQAWHSPSCHATCRRPGYCRPLVRALWSPLLLSAVVTAHGAAKMPRTDCLAHCSERWHMGHMANLRGFRFATSSFEMTRAEVLAKARKTESFGYDVFVMPDHLFEQ